MTSAHLKKFDSVKPATIEWRHQLPFSLEFDDVYFSAGGGVEESSYVFIDGTQLVGDWRSKPNQNFTIAELGFGTGLNFLNTADYWKKHLEQADQKITKHQSLHYISIEKRPLVLADLQRALQFWPQFESISKQLLNNYPSPSYGRFQIEFSALKITLTLLFMPVDDALNDLNLESQSRTPALKVDHWFLDGFAPAKNQSMWAESIIKQIAKLSIPGSKLATFSVAAAVKKPLLSCGFEIQKRKGFAKKREMLTATFRPTENQIPRTEFINIKYEKPWFNIALSSSPQHKSNQNKIAIIGGGIAGCTLAYTLSKEHASVVLYESERDIASKASGAAAGIFHPQLTSDLNLTSQFSWQAYLSLINWLSSQPTQTRKRLFISFGLERFLKDRQATKELLKLADKYLFSPWVLNSKFSGRATASVYFPDAGALNIAELCNVYMEQAISKGVDLKTSCSVQSIDRLGNDWQVTTKNETTSYQNVIYCGGANSPLFKKFNHIPTNTSRGQTCLLDCPQQLRNLDHAICEQIYLVPSNSTHLHIGSTFDDFMDEQINQISQTEILSRTAMFLKQNGLPELPEKTIAKAPLIGTVGYRLHSKDRLPLVGPAFDRLKLTKDFEELGQKKLLRSNLSTYNQTGLWLNTAYGSHGLIHSLLCSQHIASLLRNDFSPLAKPISDAIHPARFIIKSLK
jgi:tRNA 5-methylaminomethyl-2-thiouridine biosynthesis bifunctional protein